MRVRLPVSVRICVSEGSIFNLLVDELLLFLEVFIGVSEEELRCL